MTNLIGDNWFIAWMTAFISGACVNQAVFYYLWYLPQKRALRTAQAELRQIRRDERAAKRNWQGLATDHLANYEDPA